MLTVLRDAAFARLFAAQVAALVGTGLLTVALGLQAYELAGDSAGAVLGTVMAIKMVAYVVVAPVAAALAVRIARRPLLVGANAVRAATALLLLLIDQTWQVYLLIAVLQAASATFTPAFQSVIPAILVDEDDYTRGLSLSRIAYDLEALVSPALAAVLLTVMPVDGLFVATAAGMAASAVAVLATPLPATTADAAPPPFRRRLTAGSREMLTRPVLRALNMVVAAATGLVIVNSVVYVRDLLGAPTTALAALLACYGGGSLVAALAVRRLLERVPDRRVMLTAAATIALTLAATAALLASAATPAVGWPALTGAWIVLGAATSLIVTPSARLLRYQSAPNDLSAVFTAQFSLSHACFFVTYLVAGWFGAAVGQAAAVATLTVLAAAAAVAARRWWPADSPTPHRAVRPADGTAVR